MKVAVISVALLAVALSPAAQAASFRYWTYWHGSAAGWSFATAGPASVIPADGSVEGWRFAITATAGAPGDQPRITPSFADVCAGTPEEAGRKRVALVIDPGPQSTAPDGQSPGPVVATCVVADPEANGYHVLRTVAEMRTEDGLVCGIAGYPTGECAPVIDSNPGTDPTASPESVAPASVVAQGAPAASGGTAGAPWATLLVLLVAGATGLLFWRRRHG